MWEKYFKIAERQLEAGKKTVESHALKALQAAEANNSPSQIARTLDLLGDFYFQTDNPKLIETLEKSAAAAEKAFGPESTELIDALAMLSLGYQEKQDWEKAEAIQLRVLSMRKDREAKKPLPLPTFETSDEEEFGNHGSVALMDALGNLTVFYIDQGKFDQAEPHFQDWLERTKNFYGPATGPIEDIAPIYAEILSGTGREEEAKILTDMLASEGTEEEQAIFRALEERENKQDVAATVQAHRDAVEKMKALVDKNLPGIKDNDPFKELKKQLILEPHQSFQRALAEMLRAEWQYENKIESLNEAEAIARALIAATDEDLYHNLLMHILLDRALLDASHQAELDGLTEKYQDTIDGLYTKALSLFRRQGVTEESKKAINAAFKANPHVMSMLAGFAEGAPEDGDEMKIDAHRYATLAGHAWRSTEGAVDFTTETVISYMSPSMRRRIEQMVQMAQANAGK